jgi:aspartyl-tRNA(Asn)/glutamyl-tRNA(Gln) amidotransferase subunit C
MILNWLLSILSQGLCLFGKTRCHPFIYKALDVSGRDLHGVSRHEMAQLTATFWRAVTRMSQSEKPLLPVVFSTNLPQMSQAHIDVRYVAKLARLDLTDVEVAVFQSQLDAILGHVESLSAIDLPDDIAAMEGTRLGPMRDDQPHASLLPEAMLVNAPDQAQSQIRVPKVVADA